MQKNEIARWSQLILSFLVKGLISIVVGYWITCLIGAAANWRASNQQARRRNRVSLPRPPAYPDAHARQAKREDAWRTWGNQRFPARDK